MTRPAEEIAPLIEDDPEEVDLLVSLCVGKNMRLQYAAKCQRSVVTCGLKLNLYD